MSAARPIAGGKFRVWWMVAWLVGACCRLGAAEAPAAERVVELPPFEVTGESGRPWQYTEVPGFEVLSRCSAGVTYEYVAARYRVVELLRLVLPDEFQIRLSAPRIVLLTDESSAPASAKEVVDRFLAGNADSAPGKSSPASAAGAGTIQFMPNMQLNEADVTAVYAILDERRFDGATLALAPDHVRFLLERRTPPLPAWFIEGFMTLFESMYFKDDVIRMSPLAWATPEEAKLICTDLDYPRTLLAMVDLFSAGRGDDSREARETGRLWREQAALFLRWSLDGTDPRRREALWKFLARAEQEPVSDAMFQACFGLTFADMRDRLSDYLPVALREPVVLRAENLTKPSPSKLRPATPGEIGRIKGDWERLEISYVKARHPQYAGRYAEQAHRTLVKAYGLGERDPRLLGVIGLYESDIGNGDAALPYLEAAVRAKVVRPRLYYQLARLRYAAAAAKLGTPSELLTPAQANLVLEPLAVGWRQSPPLAESYLLTADVWSRSDVPLGPEHFALLDEGLRQFPRDLGLTYQVAVLQLLHGRKAEAAALIERGARASSTPAVRARFEKLRALLAAGDAGRARSTEREREQD